MPFEVYNKHEGQSVDAIVETVLEELGKVGQETSVASMVVGADLTVGGTISAPANALSADVVADSATRKWLTTGTQSIAGNKTINDSLTVNNSLTVGGTTTINDNDLAHTASSGDVRYTMSNNGKSLELKLFEAGDANFNFSDASKSMYFRAGGASTISYSAVDIKLWKDVTLKKGGNAWPGVPLTFLSGDMQTVIGGDGTSGSDPTAADLKIDNVNGGAINLKSNGTTVAQVTGTGLTVTGDLTVTGTINDAASATPHVFDSPTTFNSATTFNGETTHNGPIDFYNWIRIRGHQWHMVREFVVRNDTRPDFVQNAAGTLTHGWIDGVATLDVSGCTPAHKIFLQIKKEGTNQFGAANGNLYLTFPAHVHAQSVIKIYALQSDGAVYTGFNQTVTFQAHLIYDWDYANHVITVGTP
jgi:hypothetical protein